MAYTVIGLPDVRKMVSTLELKTSYISIGHPGLMIGRGMITKLGKSIVFLNGELFQNNNLIATATSTAKILYKK
jgi:acyl-coenzyme A thioesterase PaaI-like protein